MIVSWNWLAAYVPLKMDVAELEQRLAMAGLNHESTKTVDDDLAIDLEVTSNRPDCLGHLGVAREISVLWEQPLTEPDAQPPVGGKEVSRLTNVTVECPRMCYRYTARVIRGVKIGPSPPWLVSRLRTVGLNSVNNVVDISNYVLMECGQPLHVFDLNLLQGPEIIVREARDGEQFEAIDHRMYTLDPSMCVIADGGRPVALGGVMGGVESEIHDETTDLLIESAEFAPLSIRNTARQLGLHSPSSYRFERGVDPVRVEWASRRCCELILELAGGQLAPGIMDIGAPHQQRAPITLRLHQLPRILGIDVPLEEVRRILTALGNEEVGQTEDRIEVIPPSWRRDLAREVDLVEEVARIHGYDEIPEDVSVPMAPSQRTDDDRVLETLRRGVTAAGIDEAMTVSVVPEKWTRAFSPWSDAEPLRCRTPMLKGADRLRKSLIPSLLEARRINESMGNDAGELFETAHVYLPRPSGLPQEPWMLGIVSGRDFFFLKGVVESCLELLHIDTPLVVQQCELPLLDPVQQCRLELGEQVLGYLGLVSSKELKQFGLKTEATVAELDLSVLASAANLVPQQQPLSEYPPIARDLNLVVDESVNWATLKSTVAQAAGPLLETLRFQEVYRDPNKDGAGKKRLFFSITLRSPEQTLTNEQADEIRDKVVSACAQQHHATLLNA
ncbi:MAG: phenylalanine--tRNA ligase subunit beta [Planctomycetota bacterium]